MNQCAHSEDDDDDCKLSGTGATKAMEWSQRDKKKTLLDELGIQCQNTLGRQGA